MKARAAVPPRSAISVHVERIAFAGLDLEPRHVPALRLALERELMKLIASKGLNIRQSVATPAVTAAALPLAGAMKAGELGRTLARNLYAVMGGKP